MSLSLLTFAPARTGHRRWFAGFDSAGRRRDGCRAPRSAANAPERWSPTSRCRHSASCRRPSSARRCGGVCVRSRRGRVVNGAATPERTIKDPYPRSPVCRLIRFGTKSSSPTRACSRSWSTTARRTRLRRQATPPEAGDRRREDEYRVSVECLGRPEDRRNLRRQQRHARHHRRVRRRRQRRCGTGAQHRTRRMAPSGSRPPKRTTKC